MSFICMACHCTLCLWVDACRAIDTMIIIYPLISNNTHCSNCWNFHFRTISSSLFSLLCCRSLFSSLIVIRCYVVLVNFRFERHCWLHEKKSFSGLCNFWMFIILLFYFWLLVYENNTHPQYTIMITITHTHTQILYTDK